MRNVSANSRVSEPVNEIRTFSIVYGFPTVWHSVTIDTAVVYGSITLTDNVLSWQPDPCARN